MLWNIHSYYSLRYGTLSIDNIMAAAKHYQLSTMGLTDINCSTGIWEFVKRCNEDGIKPLAGIEFMEANHLLFTALAKNAAGVAEINKMLSNHNLYGMSLSEQTAALRDTFIIYPYTQYPKKLEAHERIGIRINELNKLLFKDISAIKNKLVLKHPVTFAGKSRLALHKHLRAIENNLLLSRLTAEHSAQDDEYFKTDAELIDACQHYPFIIHNTKAMIEECNIVFDFKTHKNKKIYSASSYDDKQLLEKLAFDGVQYRYGLHNRVAFDRVKRELEIIDKLGFSAYFLITWDIIRYSMSKGFYHVGRGSGANSVVAYCLRITDVDPIELNLYFERFLNPKRTSPPDFDIDYSWKERPQLHDYIFKRYGRDYTALLGTISTFKDNSIYRELGKVYGLPKAEIDILANFPEKADASAPIIKNILKVGELLKDFPNHRSIHAGGVLISDEPIYLYSALDLPPVGLPTVQWDMYISEDIGFEKFDILSQRGIGHIKDAAELVWQNKKIRIDIHDVQAFKNDEKVKSQLKLSDSIGCFYIESPAMRGLLKKLQCDTYIHLVAASSIIRPGVAKSGMMREYIHRFHHPEAINYLHPVMKEQLEETYGVMVFQEDVLKVCHHFAGLDLADADVLRRAMSGKFRSKAEFQRIIDKFFSNCHEKGYPENITKEIWRQIESFAGYSFSKAHSASYAVESFQSLYLKTYFPKEFMVAVINNFGGFYQTWVYFNELKKTGAHLHLPCVNHSLKNTHIYGDDVYIGFVHIESLEAKTIELILHERKQNGVFLSLYDFIERTSISIEQLKILVKVGAFRFTGSGKKNLLWQIYMHADKKTTNKEMLIGTAPMESSLFIPQIWQSSMFSRPAKNYTLPLLAHDIVEDAYDEIEILGFPVSISQFDLLITPYRGDVLAKDFDKHLHKTIRIVGNYVAQKGVKTVKGEYMAFGTFYDCENHFFDTTNFSQSIKKYPFAGRGVYLIEGKVVDEFGFCSLEVIKMARLAPKPDPRY